LEKKGKFRDKLKNKKEYHQQLKVKKKYLSKVRMRRCYQAFCNNKTEQLHGFVVNICLQKCSHFCRTIFSRARTYLYGNILYWLMTDMIE
jgi:DNA-directed RNA polymerase specialized sigma54-like protein